MPELSALRAQLKDRQVKEGALGTVEVTICLDLSLLADLAELEKRRFASTPPSEDRSLAGAPDVNHADLDAQIEAKNEEIRAASLLLVFRALSSVRYQELVNQFDDPDGDDNLKFYRALVRACFYEAWSEGEKVALAWDDLDGEISFGEFDEIASKVLVLNKRKQDIPFSLRPSRTARS